MEYKPAIYNIGRDVVTSLEQGHFNEDLATIDLQPFATRLIEEPCFG